jgi:hypothetical protein
LRRSSAVPNELCVFADSCLEHRCKERLRQARIIPTDTQMVARFLSTGALAPRVGLAPIDLQTPELSSPVSVAVVVGHEARFHVDRLRTDSAGPSAFFGECKSFDD